jgi:Leucine-rich repeat (LRR) protein
MGSRTAGDSEALGDRKPAFRFSLGTAVGIVALAAVSLGTVTNHDWFLDLVVLGFTTLALLAAVLVGALSRDRKRIGIVAAMVVYYAVSRLSPTPLVLLFFGWFSVAPRFPVRFIPHLGLAVGLVAAVLFLLRIRSGSPSRYFVPVSLLVCFLGLATHWYSWARWVNREIIIGSEPEPAARYDLAKVFGEDASLNFTLIELERNDVPYPHRGPEVTYEVWDGDVLIGRIKVLRWWFWWRYSGSSLSGARDLLQYAKRRLKHDPRTAEQALRRLIVEYSTRHVDAVDEAQLLLDRLADEGIGLAGPPSDAAKGRVTAADRSSTPVSPEAFFGTEEEAIAVVKRVGGRIGEPNTLITWVDLSRTKITDWHLTLLRVMPHLALVNLRDTAVSDDGLAHLRGLDHIQELVVDETQVAGSGLEHLKGSKLIALTIGSPWLKELQLQHIARFSNLEFLHLIGPVNDDCLQHLEGLSRLDTFVVINDDSLRRETVTDAGLAHLAGLVQLQELVLDCLLVTDAGVAHLKGLSNLEILSLRAPMSDAGMAHLAGLSKLRSLTLNGASVTDAGLAHLRGLTELDELTIHDLDHVELGLVHLATLTNLRQLIVSGPRLRGEALKALSGLVQLELLDLSDSPITDVDLAHLAPLSSLRQLELARTAVSDRGLVHLERLSQLEQIDLSYTNVTPAGAERLRKALPGAQISCEPKPSN